jgi:LysR family glycine cleavage system transcriptional activator
MPYETAAPAEPPSFALLRSLDAACRHRNYRRAARELSLTHGAVIASVRKLEAAAGEPMFHRVDGRMQPTRAALELASEYRRAVELVTWKWLQIRATAPRPSPLADEAA